MEQSVCGNARKSTKQKGEGATKVGGGGGGGGGEVRRSRGSGTNTVCTGVMFTDSQWAVLKVNLQYYE